MWYKNGIVFNSIQAVREDIKDISLPVSLNDNDILALGYKLIVDGVKPSATSVQYIVENGVTVTAGIPTRNWKVVDMFSDIPVGGIDPSTGIPSTVLIPKLAQETAYLTKLWKENRQKAVDTIEVTYNAVIYQGDETSQGRMARAIIGLPDNVATINWVAKDNTVHALNKIDLQTILANAGTQQANIWNLGRP